MMRTGTALANRALRVSRPKQTCQHIVSSISVEGSLVTATSILACTVPAEVDVSRDHIDMQGVAEHH